MPIELTFYRTDFSFDYADNLTHYDYGINGIEFETDEDYNVKFDTIKGFGDFEHVEYQDFSSNQDLLKFIQENWTQEADCSLINDWKLEHLEEMLA